MDSKEHGWRTHLAAPEFGEFIRHKWRGLGGPGRRDPELDEDAPDRAPDVGPGAVPVLQEVVPRPAVPCALGIRAHRVEEHEEQGGNYESEAELVNGVLYSGKGGRDNLNA